MYEFNENKIIDKSKKKLKRFLKKQNRNLITFTKDSTLLYKPKEDIEKFILDVKEKTLYIPLYYFLEEDIDENQILWHIYYELALYDDWRKNTNYYLNRLEYWSIEIDDLTHYFLKKINDEKLNKNALYNEEGIKNIIEKEMNIFLFNIDKYYSLLKTIQLFPLYRLEQNYFYIKEYLKKSVNKSYIDFLPMHKAFYNSFIYIQIYKGQIDLNFKSPFESKIFGTDYYTFLYNNFIYLIIQSKGVKERDKLIKSFIYPDFMKLIKIEIDNLEINSSDNKKQQDLSEITEKSYNDESIEYDEEDLENILTEILNEKNTIIDEEDLKKYKNQTISKDITKDEEKLFFNYVKITKNQRDDMKRFWINLIGDMNKEESIKIIEQEKGKLHVPSLIMHYPEFVEAEKSGNYKKLPIFSKSSLVKEDKILPEEIEVTFLVDNSGSMDSKKIDIARKTLSVVLLSLNDFNEYLMNHSKNIKISSETYFFGSNFRKIKKFDYNKKDDEFEDIVKSVVKLSGNSGATDDASCLKNIIDNISSKEKLNIKSGKLIKLIFEITDGASSFPGLMKNNIRVILENNIEIYAFQIGNTSSKNIDMFNYIWNENFKNPHGIVLGSNIDQLTNSLLGAIKSSMSGIFKSNS